MDDKSVVESHLQIPLKRLVSVYVYFHAVHFKLGLFASHTALTHTHT